MNFREKFFRFERSERDWRRLLVQGAIILLIGATLALSSLFNPGVTILFAHGFSVLPLSGLVLMTLGVLECMDAFLAKESRNFYQNLQVGVLDVVVSSFIVLGVEGELNSLRLLISAFLIVRGTVRLILVHTLQLPQIVSTSLGGLISILLGILIRLEWPSSDGWFLAFCLSTEIGIRGWATMMFSLWLKKQTMQASMSQTREARELS